MDRQHRNVLVLLAAVSTLWLMSLRRRSAASEVLEAERA
jgi:hypothetical protein